MARFCVWWFRDSFELEGLRGFDGREGLPACQAGARVRVHGQQARHLVPFAVGRAGLRAPFATVQRVHDFFAGRRRERLRRVHRKRFARPARGGRGQRGAVEPRGTKAKARSFESDCKGVQEARVGDDYLRGLGRGMQALRRAGAVRGGLRAARTHRQGAFR